MEKHATCDMCVHACVCVCTHIHSAAGICAVDIISVRTAKLLLKKHWVFSDLLDLVFGSNLLLCLMHER
jgi:hypothetical protein